MSKRIPPKRPPSPNSKGLDLAETLHVKLLPATLAQLKTRARYETVRWRVENGGKGRAISPQDVVRRVIEDYFRVVRATPDDAVGRALKRLKALR